MRASDLFIKCLEEEGVKYIFGVPGEENLDVLDSLRDSPIKVILTRNEQSAVFMAATYGRFTGKPGVALATLGPGATNMVTGVGYAQLNGLPVIVVTGQKPIKKSKQGSFQIVDVVSMMKPITKWATQIQSGSRITSTVREAFKIASSERPGAVHIELPEDIAKEKIKNYKPIKPQPIRRPIVEEKAFDLLVQKLEKAKTPVILIGAGANRKRITKYLSKFIEKYNIPFFESQMGKGVVDERMSQYIGTAALSNNDSVHKAVVKSDLILAIGHDVIEKPTNFVCEGKTQIIHINYYEAKIDDVYMPSLEVIGDIGNLFWRLYERNLKTSKWNHKEIYKIAKREREKSLKSESKENKKSVLMPRRFVRELREIMNEEDIIALDNGWYKIWIARNYITSNPNTVLLDNTFATMGAGVSIGAMAKFLNQDKSVVTIVGDGGFMMNLGDLETAVRLKTDLTIIILNNSALGMIKIKQALQGFKKFSFDLKNPDFIKLAESFGAKGFRVKDKKDFKRTIKKAKNTKGVSIVEVLIEYPLEID